MELYKLANFTEDISDLSELIRDKFIKAIDDKRVTPQVDIHNLPGNTKLTGDQICEYKYVLQKSNHQACANRVTTSHKRDGNSNFGRGR